MNCQSIIFVWTNKGRLQLAYGFVRVSLRKDGIENTCPNFIEILIIARVAGPPKI